VILFFAETILFSWPTWSPK